MIDHAYYPHIIDLIFSFASHSSLFAMSHVCSGWRQRAHVKFTHVHDLSVDIGWSGRLEVEFRLGANGPKFWGVPFQREKLRMLEHCRILDVISLPPRTHVPLDKFVPSARTIRYRCTRAMLYDTRQISPGTSVRRLVYFDEFPPLDRSISVEELVYVDSSSLQRPLAMPSSFPPAVRRVTYIFTGDPREHRAGYTEAGEELVPGDMLYRLRLHSVIVECLRTGVQLICVDIPAHVIVDEPDHPPSIRFLTLDEYRQAIGAEEFALETDWDTGLTG